MEYLINWITGNWIEICGAIISLVYLYFSYKQIIWLWLFGLLSALFYIWIFFDSGFYADMSLQFYYVAVSLYGWFHWSAGGNKAGGKSSIKVVGVRRKEGVILLLVFLFLWLVISQVLIRFTNSQISVMDALTTSGSIVATWMLARKVLEHWLIWIVVDAISLGLYIYKGLYATAILFLVYTIVAVAGYYAWKKDMK
jgi:nicotinamide mononucleotide transporter